jgi:hypothetical protein
MTAVKSYIVQDTDGGSLTYANYYGKKFCSTDPWTIELLWFNVKIAVLVLAPRHSA